MASIDLDNTVYAVAAYYLCAKKLKVGTFALILVQLGSLSQWSAGYRGGDGDWSYDTSVCPGASLLAPFLLVKMRELHS